MLNCPICATPVDEKLFRETYLSPFNQQEYKLYHCIECDLQWWEPLKIIPEFYEKEGDLCYKTFHLGIKEGISSYHKMFFKYMPIKLGRLLDVGCGDGVFLKEAEKAGYEVWGIDFDSKSIKVCQEKRGLKNTYAMTPEEFLKFCQSKDIKFDVITFFEVLEHQDKPREFLETIKQMLKPGGYIAGSVPNRNSWLWGAVGRMSKGDFPPHHFLRFSEEALKNALSQGFRDVFVRQVPLTLSETVTLLQVSITGSRINSILLKTIFTKLAKGKSEGTTIYKTSSWQRFIYKSLRGLRFLLFLPFALAVAKLKVAGTRLYFQARA